MQLMSAGFGHCGSILIMLTTGSFVPGQLVLLLMINVSRLKQMWVGVKEIEEYCVMLIIINSLMFVSLESSCCFEFKKKIFQSQKLQINFLNLMISVSQCQCFILKNIILFYFLPTTIFWWIYEQSIYQRFCTKSQKNRLLRVSHRLMIRVHASMNSS